MSLTAHQIILTSRPQGMPTDTNFVLREAPLPTLQKDQVLLRLLYLSVDPYMRGRMNAGPSYISAFKVDHPLQGEGIAVVEQSQSSTLSKGDIVKGVFDWSDYTVMNAQDLTPIKPGSAPVSTALGVLGMTGLTAYFGLLDIGKPQAGETVVVSGAAGAVGSVVGQIAKLQGCRVIGIVGSEEKERWIKELGFDIALNYKKENFATQLKQACSNGVDVYFDNVGGNMTDQVLELINKHARIVICGQISMYNLDKPEIGPRPFWKLLTKSALAKGFIIFDYHTRFPEGLQKLTTWVKEGKIKYHENIINGLENAPKAFLGLFKGENIGKQLVKISD